MRIAAITRTAMMATIAATFRFEDPPVAGAPGPGGVPPLPTLGVETGSVGVTMGWVGADSAAGVGLGSGVGVGGVPPAG